MARKPKKPASPVTPESPGTNVPGVSTDPATNMMMADIAMRSGTTLLRHLVERKFLKGRYGKESAKEIVQNRGLKHTIASVAVARIATRSVPGALAVGGGLLVKTLFDRSQKRRKALRAGDKALLTPTQED